MTGWRLWTVRAVHAGGIIVQLWRWASSGNDGFGLAAGCLALALALTFTPRWKRS